VVREEQLPPSLNQFSCRSSHVADAIIGDVALVTDAVAGVPNPYDSAAENGDEQLARAPQLYIQVLSLRRPETINAVPYSASTPGKPFSRQTPPEADHQDHRRGGRTVCRYSPHD
jgi:hypothetical protein